MMLKTSNEEFQFVEVLFTDQNNRPLEIEDYTNYRVTLQRWDIQ